MVHLTRARIPVPPIYSFSCVHSPMSTFAHSHIWTFAHSHTEKTQLFAQSHIYIFKFSRTSVFITCSVLCAKLSWLQEAVLFHLNRVRITVPPIYNLSCLHSPMRTFAHWHFCTFVYSHSRKLWHSHNRTLAYAHNQRLMYSLHIRLYVV